jgi:hypothetical protein
MRFHLFSVATWVVALLVSGTALADKPTGAATHDGTVVSMAGDTLVMKGEHGGEHSHTVAVNAKVTLDGKACKASELKSGTRVRVTLQGDDKSPVNRIEAIDKNADFASL